MNIDMLKSIRLYIPFLSGYFMTWMCPIIDTTNIKARPPPIVFAIVWPILYLLIGLIYSYALYDADCRPYGISKCGKGETRRSRNRSSKICRNTSKIKRAACKARRHYAQKDQFRNRTLTERQGRSL